MQSVFVKRRNWGYEPLSVIEAAQTLKGGNTVTILAKKEDNRAEELSKKIKNLYGININIERVTADEKFTGWELKNKNIR